jgi:hypothetical protein
VAWLERSIGFWNGYWLYYTLKIIKYNLHWRCRQYKSIQFTIKNTGSPSLCPFTSPQELAKNSGHSVPSFPDCPRSTATATLMLVCNEKRALYWRCTASGSSSWKHHFVVQALRLWSDPLPSNGSPSLTHDCGPRSSCHNKAANHIRQIPIPTPV